MYENDTRVSIPEAATESCILPRLKGALPVIQSSEDKWVEANSCVGISMSCKVNLGKDYHIVFQDYQSTLAQRKVIWRGTGWQGLTRHSKMIEKLKVNNDNFKEQRLIQQQLMKVIQTKEKDAPAYKVPTAKQTYIEEEATDYVEAQE